MGPVREVKAGHFEGGAPYARSRALLSLDEVRASNMPAYFYDYSEELLYLDGELFDLRADPREKINQYGNPVFVTVRDRLTAALDAWRKRFA